MNDAVDQCFDLYDSGRLSRRDLIRGLAMASALAGVATNAGADMPVFQARELNHIALRATDPERTARFYERMLGATRLNDGPRTARFLAIGPHAVNLFRDDKQAFDHICFLVDNYDPAKAAARIRAAGVEPIIEQDRVFFLDPDGFKLQIGGPLAGGQKR